jgi:zinc and cadmium transporter
LVGLGAGGLIGGAFLHLIPEALEQAADFTLPFMYVILGFIAFFILEKFLYWRHCHKGKCEIHIFTYLNLFGDGLHNFVDGLIMGTSFATNIKIGIVASSAIILHEIPQELGDFGVLVYGGMKKSKALLYNFLSAVTAVFGTVAGFYFAEAFSGFSIMLMPLAAGGFIYVAACDLIPELHRQPSLKKATFSMLFFLLGILLMASVKFIHHH